MEFNRFSQRLTVIVAMVLGLVAAVVLGKLAAQGRMGPILMFGLGAAGVGLLLALKERIWLLLVLAWPMTGQIRALNLPFGVRDIIVMYVFACFVALIAFKVIRKRNVVTSTDLLMFAVLLVLAVAFVRNPVGVEALGSDRVGGRPYFNVLLAVVAWWILSRSELGNLSPSLLFGLVLFGRCLDGLLATTLYLVPQLEYFFADFYSSPVMTTGMIDESALSPLAESSGRLTFLGFIASPILIAMFAADRPLGWLSVLKPWKPLLLIIAATLLMKSGFRSALAMIILTAAFSSCLRRGSREVVKNVAIGMGCIFVAATLNGIAFELPKNIQRTLSFLPGNWDATAVSEGKTSTEWRVFMWKEALFTDRYIENKIVGDGFGMKKSDFAIMAYFQKQGGSDGIRENLMIVGNFHSGPVTCVRYVGYVGMVLYIALIVKLAREAWLLSVRHRRSKYFVFTLLICLPLIVEPIGFVFIFGSFDTAFPDAIFAIGCLKLLKTALVPSDTKATAPSLPVEMPLLPRPTAVSA